MTAANTLRRMIERATEGPWTIDPDIQRRDWESGEQGAPVVGGSFTIPTYLPRCEVHVPCSDAELVVYLVNNAPALAACVEALPPLLDSHGAHGPCRKNGCPDCRAAFAKGQAALRALESDCGPGSCPKCGHTADEHYDGTTDCPYRPFRESDCGREAQGGGCEYCGGKGFIRVPDPDGEDFPHNYEDEPCEDCDGTGRAPTEAEEAQGGGE